MKRKSLLSVLFIAFATIFFISCGGNSDNGNSKNDKKMGNFYEKLVKNGGGDFRDVTINKTTLDEAKKNEEESALAESTNQYVKYSYMIDDNNRYDVKYYFDENGKINLMAVDYYSWGPTGDEAFENGTKLYDKFFKEFTDKYGEGKKFSETEYHFFGKSESGADIKILLSDTSQKGSSGTVTVNVSLR